MAIPTIGSDDSRERHSSIIEEHRLLAEKIDHASQQVSIFFSAPAGKAPSDVKTMALLLEELLEIARSHFQHEEALMSKNSFPGLMSHKRDHDYLIKSLINFTSSLSHGTVPVSTDIGVNLQSWLTYHIKKYDEAYAVFESRSSSAGGGG